MKIKADEFKHKPGATINLTLHPTRVDDLYASKDDYKTQLDDLAKDIRDQQELLYADHRWAVLVILQGMDTSGKDGAIEHVFAEVNPIGLRVQSFKQPSAEELAHDFLWRTSQRLPERGHIAIFNRSYYEEVLVVRVHPEFLDAQHLPNVNRKAIWDQRYRSINAHEEHLLASGTLVLKFFLHISKDEQRQRLLDRINEGDKNWKFNAGDLEERELWPRYLEAYEACLQATSTKAAPWYIVPADNKKNARLVIAGIVARQLEDLKLETPKVNEQARQDLHVAKKKLEEETGGRT